jgi:hypothetical protein
VSPRITIRSTFVEKTTSQNAPTQKAAVLTRRPSGTLRMWRFLPITNNAAPLDQIRLGAAEPFLLPWIGKWVGPMKLLFFLAQLEEARRSVEGLVARDQHGPSEPLFMAHWVSQVGLDKGPPPTHRAHESTRPAVSASAAANARMTSFCRKRTQDRGKLRCTPSLSELPAHGGEVRGGLDPPEPRSRRLKRVG